MWYCNSFGRSRHTARFPYSFGRSRTGRELAASADIEVCALHILADIAESLYSRNIIFKMTYMGRMSLYILVSVTVAAGVLMSVPCGGADLRYAEGLCADGREAYGCKDYSRRESAQVDSGRQDCAPEDSLAALVIQYEGDVRAAMVRAIRMGMLDAGVADSVADAARRIVYGELPLQVRADRLREMRQEWSDRLSAFCNEHLGDIQAAGGGTLSPSSMLPSVLPVPDPDAGNGWSATRQPSVEEILERDRRLILTRMINESPEFVREMQRNPSIAVRIFSLLLGLFNFGTVGTWETLVPQPEVGGRPEFDDMIFLDPNFDPKVYHVSRPVPQYDPLDPTKPYKASVSAAGGSGIASGPPPVQKSRYVVP